MVDFGKAIKIALKTGNAIIGFEKTKKSLIKGLPKLVILAKNTPKDKFDEIIYYCKLAKIPYYVFDGASSELGTLCGNPFVVSTLAILDPGDSNIMSLVEETQE